MRTITLAAQALPLFATEAVRALLKQHFPGPVYFDPNQNAPPEVEEEEEEDFGEAQDDTFSFSVTAPLPRSQQAWTPEQVVAYYAAQWVAAYTAELLQNQPTASVLAPVQLAARDIRLLRLSAGDL